MKKFLVFLAAMFSIVACLSETIAASNITTTNNKPFEFSQFHLRPRVAIWGTVGDLKMGLMQALVPLSGNYEKAFFGIVEGAKISGSSWFAGGGLGYRAISNNKIIGGYLIADEFNSSLDNKFLILNPGFEMLGMGATNAWDMKINGYWAVQNKRLIREGWASDNFGDHRFVRDVGNRHYDHWIKQYEEAGRGGDIRVGRTIPHFEAAKVYLGGYYFNLPDVTVGGALAKITYDFNQFVALEFTDTYDNRQHNTAYLGLKISLGDYSEQEKKTFSLSTRLLENFDHGINTHYGIGRGLEDPAAAMQKATHDAGEADDGRFHFYFRPDPAVSNIGNNTLPVVPKDIIVGKGTAEDPFIGFTKANFGQAKTNAQNVSVPIALSFTNIPTTPGNTQYNFNTFASSGTFAALPTGWAMKGRQRADSSSDWGVMANQDQIVFNGNMVIDVTNNDTQGFNLLNSITLYNNGLPTNTGLTLIGLDRNKNNVTLINTKIGSGVNHNSDYMTGISVRNFTVDFTDTTINAFRSDTGDAIGINTVDSVLNFNGTTIINSDTNNASISEAYGILMTGLSNTIAFADGSNNTITVKGGSHMNDSGGIVQGDETSSSTIIFGANSTNAINVTNASNNSSSGIYLFGAGSVITFGENSHNTINVNGTSFNTYWGIFLDSGSVATFESGSISNIGVNVASSSSIYGIQQTGFSFVNLKNGSILNINNIVTNGGVSYGFYLTGNTKLYLNGTSKITNTVTSSGFAYGFFNNGGLISFNSGSNTAIISNSSGSGNSSYGFHQEGGKTNLNDGEINITVKSNGGLASGVDITGGTVFDGVTPVTTAVDFFNAIEASNGSIEKEGAQMGGHQICIIGNCTSW